MIARLTGVAIAVGITLALSACGATVSTGGGSVASPSSGSGQSINLEAQDFQFSPATLGAPTDTTIKLMVKNAGAKKHNLTIKELGVSQDLDPGSTQTVTFTTKSAASLVYYCEYHRDSKGMQGTLTVGSGGAGGTSPVPSTSPRTYVPY